MRPTIKIHSTPSWLIDLFFLIMTLGIFYALWIGGHALFTPDEGRYSEIAREMVVSHDYITPRLNGVAFLDKPILYYWLQASAIRLFGLKEWALRFWPAFAGVLGCILTWLTGRTLFNRRTGILAAIILSTSPLYYGAAHYANLDLEVAVLISITLFFSVLALHAKNSRQRTVFFILAYLFCGLAALTKGLIGIVFPAMIMGLWILLLNRWNIIKHMRLLTGLVIFFAITVPWYYLVQKANPEFLHFFFVTQQVSRFLTHGEFNNKTALWFYVPIVLAGFFPWSFFVIQAVIKNIKIVWRDREKHSAELFLLLWFGVIFIFFSIPTSKTVGYILPVFPALALMVGRYLDGLWETTCFKIRAPRLFYGCALFACTGLLILSASLGVINHKSIKPVALQLKSRLKPDDEVVTYFKYYQDLPIYLERRITIVADWTAPDIIKKDNWVRELWFGMPFQNTKDWLIDDKIFWQRWHGKKRLFVMMNKNSYPAFSEKAKNTIRETGEYNDVVWVTNRG
ncbi:MAG TPA: glycosyltransferase family 39 protein [Gammaproteobacteria bacterium]|nr:glycosyltransferase family 39 protein [Gammaproteobacteria bacterium]